MREKSQKKEMELFTDSNANEDRSGEENDENEALTDMTEQLRVVRCSHNI